MKKFVFCERGRGGLYEFARQVEGRPERELGRGTPEIGSPSGAYAEQRQWKVVNPVRLVFSCHDGRFELPV